MKRIVVKFGLLSGAISMALMLVQMQFVDRIGFDKAEILGYTILVGSFLMVFAGIRSYRDKECKGAITFGRAFGVGILITLVSSLFYVATWEIVYYNVDSMHQFMAKYADYTVNKAKASGASDAAILKQVEEMEKYKRLYENPLINAAMTFMEPFPVGLVLSLVSAGILRKKPRKE